MLEGLVVGCKEGHAYCNKCFNHTISTQVRENRVAFMSDTVRCRVCCPFCPTTQLLPAFVMRKEMPFLDDATYDCFQACIVEKAVIEAQQERDKRHADVIKQMQQATSSNPVPALLEEEVAHISEHLIIPRCPQCARQVLDFVGCAAMSCDVEDGGCGAYVCAWCLQLQVAVERTATMPGRTARLACHDHVRSCLLNPTKNVYPPSPHPQLWQGVMHELARKRVFDYIKASVPKELRRAVHVECQKRHPEIHLQDFGSKVSDGFRVKRAKRAPRILGYDQQITVLMNMNLATRARAEQVLELMGNDLDLAVEFLLA